MLKIGSYRNALIGLIALVSITIGTVQLFLPSDRSIHPVNVLVNMADEEMGEARNTLFVVWGTVRLLNAGLSMLQDANFSPPVVGGIEFSPTKVLEPYDDQIERMSDWIFYLMMFSIVLSFVIEPLVTFGFILLGIGLFIEFIRQFINSMTDWKIQNHLIWIGGYGVFFPLIFFLVMQASDIVLDNRIEEAKAKFDFFSSEEVSTVNEENSEDDGLKEELDRQLNELQEKYDSQKENLMQYLSEELTDLSQMSEFDPDDFSATPNLLNKDFSREAAEVIINAIIEGTKGETTVRGLKITFDFDKPSSEIQDAVLELLNSDTLNLENIESLLKSSINDDESIFGKVTFGVFSENILGDTLEKIGIQIQNMYEELNETEKEIKNLQESDTSVIAWIFSLSGKFLDGAYSLGVNTLSAIGEIIKVIEIGITLMALYLIKLIIFPILAIYCSFLVFKIIYKRNMQPIIKQVKTTVDEIENSSWTENENSMEQTSNRN